MFTGTTVEGYTFFNLDNEGYHGSVGINVGEVNSQGPPNNVGYGYAAIVQLQPSYNVFYYWTGIIYEPGILIPPPPDITAKRYGVCLNINWAVAGKQFKIYDYKLPEG